MVPLPGFARHPADCCVLPGAHQPLGKRRWCLPSCLLKCGVHTTVHALTQHWLKSVLDDSGMFVSSGLVYYTMYAIVGAYHDIKDPYHDIQTLYKLAFACHGKCLFIS